MKAATHQIPVARWSMFATVARTSRTQGVVVVCSRTVRRQYQAAIPKLGGNLNNVVFFPLPRSTS
jgi:hypothetical protein